MTTLYRKYRPGVFADVIGQEHILKTLQNEVILGQIAHSYLFFGPRGTGKTTMARLISKALNCTGRKDKSAEPCNACGSCTSLIQNRSLDVIEIDAASQTGVDNVRENIIENAELQPTTSRYKIFIIDEVHMLSTSAFNALLKTLEEPPAHTIFILATTELHKLPATVISRCQRFHFQKIPADLMRERLKKILSEEKVAVEDEVLRRIIRQSEGCLRDAESLLGQILSLGGTTITVADAAAVLPLSDTGLLLGYLDHIIKKDAPGALTDITKLLETGGNLDRFFVNLIEMLRAILLIQAAPEQLESLHLDYSGDDLAHLKELSVLVTEAEVVTVIELALKRRLEIRTAPLPQLPLELLTIEWTCRGQMAARPTTTPTQGTKQPMAPAPAKAAPALAPVKTTAQITESPISPTAPTLEPATFTDSIKTALSSITGHKCHTSLADISARWNEVTSQLTASNPSITFILKMSTLVAATEEGLSITVPFALHQEKLMEAKNRKLIEQALYTVFNDRIILHCSTVPAAESAPGPSEAATITNLAAEFGGEVVG